MRVSRTDIGDVVVGRAGTLNPDMPGVGFTTDSGALNSGFGNAGSGSSGVGNTGNFMSGFSNSASGGVVNQAVSGFFNTATGGSAEDGLSSGFFNVGLNGPHRRQPERTLQRL
jgi:hypothetical protein